MWVSIFFSFEIKLKLHLTLMPRAMTGMISLVLRSQCFYRKAKPIDPNKARESFWQLKMAGVGIFFPLAFLPV